MSEKPKLTFEKYVEQRTDEAAKLANREELETFLADVVEEIESKLGYKVNFQAPKFSSESDQTVLIDVEIPEEAKENEVRKAIKDIFKSKGMEETRDFKDLVQKPGKSRRGNQMFTISLTANPEGEVAIPGK